MKKALLLSALAFCSLALLSACNTSAPLAPAAVAVPASAPAPTPAPEPAPAPASVVIETADFLIMVGAQESVARLKPGHSGATVCAQSDSRYAVEVCNNIYAGERTFQTGSDYGVTFYQRAFATGPGITLTPAPAPVTVETASFVIVVGKTESVATLKVGVAQGVVCFADSRLSAPVCNNVYSGQSRTLSTGSDFGATFSEQ